MNKYDQAEQKVKYLNSPEYAAKQKAEQSKKQQEQEKARLEAENQEANKEEADPFKVKESPQEIAQRQKDT